MTDATFKKITELRCLTDDQLAAEVALLQTMVDEVQDAFVSKSRPGSECVYELCQIKKQIKLVEQVQAERYFDRAWERTGRALRAANEGRK